MVNSCLLPHSGGAMQEWGGDRLRDRPRRAHPELAHLRMTRAMKIVGKAVGRWGHEERRTLRDPVVSSREVSLSQWWASLEHARTALVAVSLWCSQGKGSWFTLTRRSAKTIRSSGRAFQLTNFPQQFCPLGAIAKTVLRAAPFGR
jgi:hypothetical protein